MGLTPRRHGPHDPALADILRLLRDSFAGMENRIDPPSSMHRLTLDDLRRQAAMAEVWSLGTPPLACVIFTPKPGALYLGKLAVSATARGQGIARQLIGLAATRALALGLPCLELQTRIELTENHATFRALGFSEVARTAHPGHSRATSITYRRNLG